MAEVDITGVKANVSKMIDLGAPEADIDDYLALKGVTAEQLRGAPKPTPEAATPVFGEFPGIANPTPDAKQKLGNTLYQAADTATFGLGPKAYALGRSINGVPYDEALKQERKQIEDFQKSDPALAITGQLGGALGSAGGLMKAGVTMAPQALAKGTPLLMRMGLMGAEGAAYGGANAAGHTDRMADLPKNTLQGMEEGGTIGAALPAAGSAVGGAYRTVAPFFQKSVPEVSRGANSLLGTAARTGEQAIQDVSQLGPQAMLADASPSFRGLAQGVATKPSEGADILVNALKSRNLGRNDRLAEDLTSNFGVPQSQAALAQTLKDARAEITRPLYKEVFSNPPPVDPTPVLKTIESKLVTAEGPEKIALNKARDMLMVEAPAPAPTPPPPLPAKGATLADLKAWQEADAAYKEAAAAAPKTIMVPQSNAENLHNAKVALSGMIEHGDPSLGIAPGALSKEQGALKLVTGELNDTLQKQVPGYAAANAKSAEYAGYGNDLERGFGVLDKGKGAVWPRDYEITYQSRTPEGQAALRAGMRADLENKVGTQANDLSVLKREVGDESGWNRAKMATTFGEEPTNRLGAAVNREAAFADTHNSVYGGSQTAPRLAGSRMIDGKDIGEVPHTAYGALAKALRNAYRYVSSASSDKVRNELGEILSATGDRRDALARALLAGNAGREATAEGLRQTVSNPALARALSAYGADPANRSRQQSQ